MSSEKVRIRRFRRGDAITSPQSLHSWVTTWLSIICVWNLLVGEIVWGSVLLVGAIVSLVDHVWQRHIPIVTVAGDRLIVHRWSFLPCRLVDLAEVSEVDESRPTRLRIVEEGGRETCIPRHWVALEDYPELVRLVRGSQLLRTVFNKQEAHA